MTRCIIEECLYNTDQQLFRRVKNFSHKPESARIAAAELQVSEFKQGIFFSFFFCMLNFAIDVL